MQILFGETVRRLRREKCLTQEALAQRLNVSFQTISKWERGESYPDITMLPVLAGFFGVRTDDLLGVNEAENEKYIQSLLDYFYHNEHTRVGGLEEHEAMLQQALKDFPNDYRLWSLHFGKLCSIYFDTAESLRARLPEIRRTYETILEGCTNDALRIEVKNTMCTFYNFLVREDPEGSGKEQALLKAIVDELPTMFDSREYTRTWAGSTKTDEEHRKDCQCAIRETLEMLHHIVGHMDWEDMACKRSLLDIYDAAYPDGDYGEETGYIVLTWEMLAVMHAQAGEFDVAFAALEHVIEIARRFDALPRVSAHTSPLFRGYVFEKNPERTAAEGVRRFLNEEEHSYPSVEPWWPEAFKADPRFGEMVSRLS